jgi:hypothetical protein
MGNLPPKSFIRLSTDPRRDRDDVDERAAVDADVAELLGGPRKPVQVRKKVGLKFLPRNRRLWLPILGEGRL